MSSSVFFNHSQHLLKVADVNAGLDVLAFKGREQLSQPFNCRVEFTSTERDLAAESLLGQDASFSLHAAPQKLPIVGLSAPEVKPLRTLHGVATGFKRQSGSNDQATDEITLQPRLTRPYIAHALHDSQHVDPVTLRKDKRNVLRTPAYNKLRVDDTRGQAQLNLQQKDLEQLHACGSYITLDPFSFESGTEGDYIVKSASYEYVMGAAKQVVQMPQPPPATEYDADSLSSTVFSG